MGSLAAFFWRFEPEAGARPKRMTWRALKQMAKTPESTALSRELKTPGLDLRRARPPSTPSCRPWAS